MRPIGRVGAPAPPTPVLPASPAALDAPTGSVWVGRVMLALVAATPFLAFFGNLGFAPVVALAGLATLRSAAPERAAWLRLLPLAIGLAWALASLRWSVFRPPAGFRFRDLEQWTGLKLVLELVSFGALAAAAGRTPAPTAGLALRIGAWGLAALSLVVLVEAFDGAAIYQAVRTAAHLAARRTDWAVRDMARATYVCALLFWPAALALARRGAVGVAVAMAAAIAIASLALHVDSPFVALAASGLVFAGVRVGGRGAVMVVGAGVAGYFALAPAVVALVGPSLGAHALSTGVGKASWAARLQIWSFVEGLVQQRPFLGWGLDASRAFPGVIPLHPHDAALQLWLELGAPGVIAATLFWMLVFASVLRLAGRDRGAAAAAAAAACAYLVIGALSFGVWQEWWLALGALAAAWVALLDRAGPLDAGASLPPAIASGRRSAA